MAALAAAVEVAKQTRALLHGTWAATGKKHEETTIELVGKGDKLKTVPQGPDLSVYSIGIAYYNPFEV